MTQELDNDVEFDPDLIDWDDYYPDEAWDVKPLEEQHVKDMDHGKVDEAAATYSHVSNNDFLESIFGDVFSSAHPLVCNKQGDPGIGGWPASRWPCNTTDPHRNWYTLPSLYRPDESGRYRAKKEFAVSVHAVMVDDVGTKVSADRFGKCPPTWSIETSPGNCQYGYILAEPITDLDIADKLKEQLIEADLCDRGATGGIARWMRLPVAINGRPKYGQPSPKCCLVQWRPELRYSVEDLRIGFGLQLQPPIPLTKPEILNANHESENQLPVDDAALVIDALK